MIVETEQKWGFNINDGGSHKKRGWFTWHLCRFGSEPSISVDCAWINLWGSKDHSWTDQCRNHPMLNSLVFLGGEIRAVHNHPLHSVKTCGCRIHRNSHEFTANGATNGYKWVVYWVHHGPVGMFPYVSIAAKDVFLHLSDCGQHTPRVSDMVKFTVERWGIDNRPMGTRRWI